MARKYAVAVTVLLLTLLPTPVYACSGFIDCLFGMTDRTEIRNDRMIEVSRIEAERDAEVTRLQGEADAKVKQADAEVERMRQMQFESETARAIAVANAQARAEEYTAMIAGLVAEKSASINADASIQIAALQAQARIAIAGITETGSTERWRVAGWWMFAVVLVLVSGWLVALRQRGRDRALVLLVDSGSIDWRRMLDVDQHKVEVVDVERQKLSQIQRWQ